MVFGSAFGVATGWCLDRHSGWRLGGVWVGVWVEIGSEFGSAFGVAIGWCLGRHLGRDWSEFGWCLDLGPVVVICSDGFVADGSR